MTDRVVTVPDSLEIPADVKVPSARLSDSTAAGRALLDAADAAAQRTALGLGTAATTPATDYATAAQGAKADASDVAQITLTGNLALTIPEGHPAGQVYRCAITQDGTGGHTVTYDDQPVSVDPTAGASTTVELHPVGAGYVIRYPATAPVPTLPAPSGVDDTAAMQAVLTAHAGRRIVGHPGASYIISAPLVISSGTTLDVTGCTITLKAGSHCRMLQNSSLLGSGARDTDIHIIGGYWDRGANAGAGFNLFGICLHRADRISVTRARFHGTAGKYACYFVDVTNATAEKLDFVTESDGLHITGPAATITVRDITGATGDDLVSFTGRDYATYELTPGGGNISDVVVERVTHRGGDGNTVKLLPGAGMVLENATVRDIGGTPDLQAVSLYSDTNFASTTGGTLKSITLENIGGKPLSGIWVQCIVPDVQGLRINGLHLDKPSGIRGLQFSGAGGICTDLSITGVTTATDYMGDVIHLASGYTIQALTVSDAVLRHSASAGGTRYLIYVQGTVNVLQLSRVTQWEGESLVQIVAGGSAPKIAIGGLHSTIAGYALMHQGTTAVDLSISGVTSVPQWGLVRLHVAGSSLTLRGQGIVTSSSAHVSRSATQTVRAIGIDVRVDKSILTPVAGDVVTDTSGTAPNGVVVYTGSAWKNLWATA